jgi:L-aspartate oxidase (EC 1.4.3.16)
MPTQPPSTHWAYWNAMTSMRIFPNGTMKELSPTKSVCWLRKAWRRWTKLWNLM